jgi:hypothetical protein
MVPDKSLPPTRPENFEKAQTVPSCLKWPLSAYGGVDEFPTCGLARCGNYVWFRFVPIQSCNENHRRYDDDQKNRSQRTQPNQNMTFTLSHTYLSQIPSQTTTSSVGKSHAPVSLTANCGGLSLF